MIKADKGMSKTSFIEKYCSASGVSEDEFNADYIALPCSCEINGCNGWAVVSDNPLSIKTHNELYNR